MEETNAPADDTLVTWSKRSSVSKCSRVSSASSAVVMALAEAEEAKAKVKYAEMEMQIKVRSAQLDAERPV